MYRISKRMMFSASHRLAHLPPEHKCFRLHGHNYTVEVRLASIRLDERGFVADFAEIGDLLKDVKEHFDHQDLNEVLGSSFLTTAENLAQYIYHRAYDFPNLIPFIESVMVSETENTWAEYSER